MTVAVLLFCLLYVIVIMCFVLSAEIKVNRKKQIT